jgi:hypothetical protein
MFFHDPFGHSDAESLYNFGVDKQESNYMYFFDQEPIHLDMHEQTFDEVVRRNTDISWPHQTPGSIVTSEHDSESVRYICEKYGWQSYYYFFHGWAALDWFRGYDKAFLIADARDRIIQKSFISANRIVGGKRHHRLILMYHLLEKKIHNAHISFPSICPAESVDVQELVQQLQHRYPDMPAVFAEAMLPWHFKGETEHLMHSCWLSLFSECGETCAYVVTETVQEGHRQHLTEKTFKPICLQMPFVLVSTMGSLDYLRRYGFKTFGHIWDESYDHEPDDHLRLAMIADILKGLDNCSPAELRDIYRHAHENVLWNYKHFYGGGFEALLWQELQAMLRKMQQP